MGIFHCHVTRGVSLTSKNDWRNASALSCVEVFFGLSMVGSFWTNMLNPQKSWEEESQVDSYYPWVGGKKKDTNLKNTTEVQKIPRPWKPWWLQRQAFPLEVQDQTKNGF